MRLFIQFILTLTLSFPTFAKDNPCEPFLNSPTTRESGAMGPTDAEALQETVRAQVETELKSKGFTKSEIRGYSILITAMITSAATATYLTAALPDDLRFLSHFVAQISTLGIYVFGAPIWEPLSSGFRKIAFGTQNNRFKDFAPKQDEFEKLWWRTQENYSLNAQMSRNVINQFIISVQHNFHEAYRAFVLNAPAYAADQVAEAAFRQRTLFKDISPTDSAVAAVVRTALTNHMELTPGFAEDVLKKISALDPEYIRPEVQAYYQTVIATWLPLKN